MVRLYIILGLIISSYLASAQSEKPFVKVSSSKRSVYVEQPLKISITVYTSTWFTAPLQIDNLQIEGAFIQSFKRTQSAIKYIDKKKYATLEFYYIVFPYQSGELVFPALSIKVSSPPEGDYKGVLTQLKSKPISIDVKPVPDNVDEDRWLVATNVSLRNKWSLDLKKLKVGDVLERDISITANGTLPSFIDEPIIEDVEFAKIYTSSPKFIDLRDDKSTNGRRTDSYSYLIEKEGSFTIPAVEVSWYNPYLGKSYKRQLPEYTIGVMANPELTSLSNLRDSLNALNPILNDEIVEDKTLITKAELLRLALIIFALIIGLWLLTKAILLLKRKVERSIVAYENSEPYWFNFLKKAKTEKEVINSTYQWMDNAKEKIQINQINEMGIDELQGLKKQYYSNSQHNKNSISTIKRAIASWRKQKLSKKQIPEHEDINKDINE